MPLEDTKIIADNATPAKIIAAGIVIAFCYWASSVLVTVLVAVLLAYFLDPVVTFMENWHVPRALGSLIVVLFTIAVLLFVAWSLVERVDQFGRDWPKYRAPLHAVANVVEQKLASVEEHVSEIGSSDQVGEQAEHRIVAVAESHPVRAALVSRLSSLYEVVLGATFIPFLLFFMLAAKRQVWHATMQLFPTTERTLVKETLTDISLVLRSYVVGTAMVGVILVVLSWLFFLLIGLEFPFPHRPYFRHLQPDSVSRRSPVLDAAFVDWIKTISHCYTVHWNFRCAHFFASWLPRTCWSQRLSALWCGSTRLH